MIVVALSSVCDYGMAQTLPLGKAATKMILLVLPKQCIAIVANDLLSCNQSTRVVLGWMHNKAPFDKHSLAVVKRLNCTGIEPVDYPHDMTKMRTVS